jgi:hypothetical protein
MLRILPLGYHFARSLWLKCTGLVVSGQTARSLDAATPLLSTASNRGSMAKGVHAGNVGVRKEKS